MILKVNGIFVGGTMDANNLRKMRKSARLSQWKVACALGKTQGWLSNVELGYVTPGEKVARKIAAAIEKLKGGRA